MSSSHYVLKIQYVHQPVETRNIDAAVTVIGREAGDIVLGDAQASGRHAEIHFQNGQVSVRDLGSTNGTFFNGQRSMSFQLGPGQSFTIGQSVFTVMAVQGAPARGPAKTMIAMGGVPPKPPGASSPGFGAPPSAGFGAPPPSGFGAPPPAAPPMSPAASGMAGGAPAAPASGAFGAPVGHASGSAPGGKLGGAPAPGGMQGAAPGPAQPQPPAQPVGGGPGGGYGPPSGGGGGYGPPAAAAAAGLAMAPGAGGPMVAPPSSPPPAAPMAQPAHGAPGAAPGVQTISMPASELVPTFSGTGGQIFGQLFVGGLLTVITAGIYMPWFMVKLINYVMSKTEVAGTARGTLRGSFTGTGGQLFVHFLLGYLLVIVTLGIYTPWFMCRLLRYGAENTTLTADDGTTYKLRFDGKGGALLGTFLLGVLLMVVTLYIYTPWFMVKLRKWLYGHTAILENGEEVGRLEFVGTGGQLLGTFLLGVLLMVVTLYIYLPWFKCKLNAFWAQNTRIQLRDRTITPDFVGKGGELFVIGLLGVLLVPLTLGIYYFWLIAKLLRFNIENHRFSVQSNGMPQIGGPGAAMAPR